MLYQAVWEKLNLEKRLQIHFAEVGGTGAIADTCQLYKTLNIPIAVIVDLDLITDWKSIRRILAFLSDEATALPIALEAKFFAKQIKNLPPTISPNEVKRNLRSLLKEPMDWGQ